MGRWEDGGSLLLPKPAGGARGLVNVLRLLDLLKKSQSLCVDECKPNSSCAAGPCLACSSLLGPLTMESTRLSHGQNGAAGVLLTHLSSDLLMFIDARTILLSVISLLNEPNTFSPANVDASVMYRKWKESKGKDREYTDIIRCVLSLGLAALAPLGSCGTRALEGCGAELCSHPPLLALQEASAGHQGGC